MKLFFSTKLLKDFFVTPKSPCRKTINFKGKLYYPKKTAFIFWISELGGNAATTDESSNDSHANDPIDPIIFS